GRAAKDGGPMPCAFYPLFVPLPFSFYHDYHAQTHYPHHDRSCRTVGAVARVDGVLATYAREPPAAARRSAARGGAAGRIVATHRRARRLHLHGARSCDG